jgi:hypothetical protein
VRLLFRLIHDIMLMIDRKRCERDVEPTVGVLDSQSVKAPRARDKGYGVDKRLAGRKRYIKNLSVNNINGSWYFSKGDDGCSELV